MKKLTFFFTATAAILLSAAASSLQARVALDVIPLSATQPNAITPGDTFTFAIAGFNSTSGTGYILGSGLTATFGTTTTFTAAGYNGQDYTITSAEIVNGTTTTDTITVSTPTNFLTTTTVNGTTITALQLDIGDANSGVGVATGANPLNYLTPVTSNTQTGNILYGTANTSFTLTPSTTLTNNGLSVAAAEGVNTGTTAISTLAIHSFTYSLTYATAALVPEPSTYAFVGAGALLLGMVTVRRNRRRSAA